MVFWKYFILFYSKLPFIWDKTVNVYLYLYTLYSMNNQSEIAHFSQNTVTFNNYNVNNE